jgi:hypothetical protein
MTPYAPRILTVFVTTAWMALGLQAATSPKTEEEWIATETVAHLMRLASLSDARFPSEDAWELELAADGGAVLTGAAVASPVTLPPGQHSWDPERFLPAATILADRLRAAAKSGQPAVPGGRAVPASIALDLLHPTAETLQAINKRLSQSLRDDPGNPGLHQQAALLLGVFALRENSGHFYDTRPTLCRMAAHAALARALKPGPAGDRPTLDALISEVLLDTLTGREQAAVDRLAAIGSGPDATAAAWRRGLDLLLRLDWRPSTGDASKPPASLLEQLGLFRALTNTVDPDSAIHALSSWPEPDTTIPDWARMVLKFDPSVPSGHFCAEAIFDEIREAALTTGFPTDDSTPEALRRLARHLNTRPDIESPRDFVIISQQQWAHHAQRHMLQCALRQIPWFGKMLGSPESAREFMVTLGPLITQLRLFPLVGFECWSALGKPERTASLNQAVDLAKNDPASVVARRWFALSKPDGAGSAMPPAASWFALPAPRGTQYNAYNRRYILTGEDKVSGEALARARALAPYEPMLAYYRASELLDQKAPPETIESACGDLLNYHNALAHVRAQSVQDDPEAYIAAMRRVVGINPDMNREFAILLVEKGRIDDAMTAYQALFDKAIDPLRSANHCDLLVHYYLAKGRGADARRIAESAAGVFSLRGLRTMVEFCIATQDAGTARTTAEAILERYNDREPLMMVAHHFPELTEELEYPSFIRTLFPDGLREAAQADLKDPPTQGIRLKAESGLTRRAGVSPQDVIVAVQGFRIANRAQYLFARQLKPGLEFSLILWDGHAYREIKAIAPERRFQVDLADYPP